MMKPPYWTRLVLTGASVSMLVGCAAAAPDPSALKSDADIAIAAATTPDDRDPAHRARAAALDFSGQLRGTLQQAMQSGGPEAAVEVCASAAPRLAAQVMHEHGVRLGRVALPGRNRNPRQAADGWQLGALREFQAAVQQGGAAAEQVMVQREGLPEGVALRMIRGIATEPGCLSCHGVAVAPSVREAIARHYPGDAATGFEAGDLRGALWVEVPLAVDAQD
jgi:hypothetical protein